MSIVRTLGTGAAGTFDTYTITYSDATTSTFQVYNGANGAGGGSGDVAGPASSTDNAIARFDGATGKVIQNSLATLDDVGNLSAGGTITSRTPVQGQPSMYLKGPAEDANWGGGLRVESFGGTPFAQILASVVATYISSASEIFFNNFVGSPIPITCSTVNATTAAVATVNASALNVATINATSNVVLASARRERESATIPAR